MACSPYRADAARRNSILPLGGVYWEDEIPDFRTLHQLPEAARSEILRLFAIRFKLRRGEQLSDEEDCFWSDARSAAPGHGIFRRTSLSPEDRSEQEATEKLVVEFFEAVAATAEQMEVEDNGTGLASWSATINLQNSGESERRVPWWKRLWRRR